MKKLPFIIIFDIDETLIGRITHVIREKILLEYLYNNCKKKSINAKCPNTDILNMVDELNNGLLRPFAADFITFCNKKFKNVEVFFYTISSYSWTNGGLAKNIEKALFNLIELKNKTLKSEDLVVKYFKVLNLFILHLKTETKFC